jgi:hypothetical protein
MSILEEKEAIRDLLSTYCFHVDDCEFDKFAALFADDGIFEPGPKASTRAATRSATSSRRWCRERRRPAAQALHDESPDNSERLRGGRQ